jgi:hypothetical protein
MVVFDEGGATGPFDIMEACGARKVVSVCVLASDGYSE